MCTSAVAAFECASKSRFFNQSSQKNRNIHCTGFGALGEIDLLQEPPIAQNKMLCSEDMKAAEIGFVWGVPGFSSAWERNRPYCQLPSALMLRSVSAVVTLGIWGTISTFP